MKNKKIIGIALIFAIVLLFGISTYSLKMTEEKFPGEAGTIPGSSQPPPAEVKPPACDAKNVISIKGLYVLNEQMADPEDPSGHTKQFYETAKTAAKEGNLLNSACFAPKDNGGDAVFICDETISLNNTDEIPRLMVEWELKCDGGSEPSLFQSVFEFWFEASEDKWTTLSEKHIVEGAGEDVADLEYDLHFPNRVQIGSISDTADIKTRRPYLTVTNGNIVLGTSDWDDAGVSYIKFGGKTFSIVVDDASASPPTAHIDPHNPIVSDLTSQIGLDLDDDKDKLFYLKVQTRNSGGVWVDSPYLKIKIAERAPPTCTSVPECKAILDRLIFQKLLN